MHIQFYLPFYCFVCVADLLKSNKTKLQNNFSDYLLFFLFTTYYFSWKIRINMYMLKNSNKKRGCSENRITLPPLFAVLQSLPISLLPSRDIQCA